MTSEELDVQSILAVARQAGLPLTEEEAAELVQPVARMRGLARRVRELLHEAAEPAPVFRPSAEEAP